MSVLGFIDRLRVGFVLDLQLVISHRAATGRFPRGLRRRATRGFRYVSQLPKTQSTQKVSLMATSSLQLFPVKAQCRGYGDPPPPHKTDPAPPPGAQRRLWNRAIKSESVVQHGRKKTPRGGRYAGLLLQFSTVTDGEGRDVGQNDAFG